MTWGVPFGTYDLAVSVLCEYYPCRRSGPNNRGGGVVLIESLNYMIMNDRISYEEKKELPDSVFGLPQRREYPMPDAAHVRAAEAYFRYCPEELKPQLARAILRRAKEFGVDVESPTVLDYATR